ncbi:hypothetical protein LTWDN19_20510 [Latilactobacillus curvatus]|uniref:Uncharacterized protein n=1 Tax=Latilactobacillus curvatus TaxID=28038 RepID=A0ABM7QWN3_LATCU|nr:hypothetical protein LTWDN19_20510 [Latilactobacillus curvatus]
MDKSFFELVQIILDSDYSPTVKLVEIQRVIDVMMHHENQ